MKNTEEDDEENNSVLDIVGKSSRKQRSLTGTIISKKHSSSRTSDLKNNDSNYPKEY